jgi:hypothetical protein
MLATRNIDHFLQGGPERRIDANLLCDISTYHSTHANTVMEVGECDQKKLVGCLHLCTSNLERGEHRKIDIANVAIEMKLGGLKRESKKRYIYLDQSIHRTLNVIFILGMFHNRKFTMTITPLQQK